MGIKEELEQRAQVYAQGRGLILAEPLGSGVHGIVFATESHQEKDLAKLRSAVKVHRGNLGYTRERDVYLRLREQSVTVIRGCHVPDLLDYDDELWVLEMTIVTRPFLLDFAGAFLDTPPDFSPEVLADWRAEKQEQFGPHWPEVQAVLRSLENYGVFMVDVNPGNVAFGD